MENSHDMYFFTGYILDSHNTEYGLRFVNDMNVCIDITYGQLFTFVQKFVSSVDSTKSFIKSIVTLHDPFTVNIAETYYRRGGKITLSFINTSLIDAIFLDSLTIAENDDVQVINYPHYTIRYKKSSTIKRFKDYNTELADCATRFVYGSRLIERLAGWNVSFKFFANGIDVVIGTLMDRDTLRLNNHSDAINYVNEIVKNCLKSFLGKKYETIAEKVINKVDIQPGFGDTFSVIISLNKGLVYTMDGRKDFLDINVRKAHCLYHDTLMTKNGFITTEVEGFPYNDHKVKGHSFNIVGKPLSDYYNRYTVQSCYFCFEMYFKTGDKVLTGEKLYYRELPNLGIYKNTKLILSLLFEEAEDYFNEYGRCLCTDPGLKIYKGHCLVYKLYDISENVYGSSISQRIEMFKEVWTTSINKIANKSIPGLEAIIKPTIVRNGKKLLVGISIDVKEKFESIAIYLTVEEGKQNRNFEEKV